MQIYIKTDKTGKLFESSISEIEDAAIIEITDEQFYLIQKQYDTIIKDGKIIEQIKGENAINIENSLIDNQTTNELQTNVTNE
jgi:hypothetical protein